MEISKEILNDIVDTMEMSLKCFLHRETFEVVSYPDPEEHLDMDPEDWEEAIGKVKKNKKKFIEIEAMTSSGSFKVMEEFIESLDNSDTKIRLVTALEGRKPFANFNHQIDNSGEYRELWFAFKRQKSIEWVQNQLPFQSK